MSGASFLYRFFTFYMLLLVVSLSLIRYNNVNIVTILMWMVAITSLLAGAKLGQSLKPYLPSKFLIKIKLNIYILNIVFLPIISYSVIALWQLLVTKYGSFAYILANSFTIRTEMIGMTDSIFPVYLTYLISLSYAFFCIAIDDVLEHKKHSKFIAVAWFLVIVFNDMLTFGRIGILYAIFVVMTALIIRKRFFLLKNLIWGISFFCILMLPRYIRGGGDASTATVINYVPYFKFDVPSIFYPIISVLVYYTGSIFAFNEFIESTSYFDYALGQRTFTPIANLLNRFILHVDRIDTIDTVYNIPFDFNILSIVHDYYVDFGVLGVILLSILLGVMIGIIFESKSRLGKSLSYSIGAVVFYWPIYFAFSFASFFISFIFLLFLTIFTERSDGNIDYNSNI